MLVFQIISTNSGIGLVAEKGNKKVILTPKENTWDYQAKAGTQIYYGNVSKDKEQDFLGWLEGKNPLPRSS